MIASVLGVLLMFVIVLVFFKENKRSISQNLQTNDLEKIFLVKKLKTKVAAFIAAYFWVLTLQYLFLKG